MNEIIINSDNYIVIKKENKNLSIVSVDSSERILLRDTIFTNCTFVDSSFSNITLVNCTFENCNIQDLELDNIKFINSNFIDFTKIINTIFKSCTFSNAEFHELQSCKNSQFIHSYFINTRILESNFDNSTFTNSDLGSLQLNYSTFRNTTFQDITHFLEQGAIVANNFYNINTNDEYLLKHKDYFLNCSNIDKKDDFVHFTINKILDSGEPLHLDILGKLLEELELKQKNILQYKDSVKEFYMNFIIGALSDGKNIQAGDLINEYYQLPYSIFENLISIPPKQNLLGNNLNTIATITIVFKNDTKNSFKDISYTNKQLFDISNLINPNNDYEVLNIEIGSIVESFMGNIEDIALIGGMLYAGTKAILSLQYKSLEIEQKKLENQKLKQETENLKLKSYLDTLELNKIIDSDEAKTIQDNFIKDKEKHSKITNFISKLDNKYNIEKITIKFNK